jgi:RimJ/RimL family protein N-acetyltransferase
MPPLVGALLKNEQDVTLFEKLVFMQRTTADLHRAGAGRCARRGTGCPSPCWTAASGEVIGCTSLSRHRAGSVERLEIGWTWYAQPFSAAPSTPPAKLLLMQHAFETLGAQLVGWRTDIDNLASQRAIERLGARKDGVLRHHALRRDGTVRDTVMYSLTAAEWPEVRSRLEWQLARPR